MKRILTILILFTILALIAGLINSWVINDHSDLSSPETTNEPSKNIISPEKKSPEQPLVPSDIPDIPLSTKTSAKQTYQLLSANTEESGFISLDENLNGEGTISISNPANEIEDWIIIVKEGSIKGTHNEYSDEGKISAVTGIAGLDFSVFRFRFSRLSAERILLLEENKNTFLAIAEMFDQEELEKREETRRNLETQDFGNNEDVSFDDQPYDFKSLQDFGNSEAVSFDDQPYDFKSLRD